MGAGGSIAKSGADEVKRASTEDLKSAFEGISTEARERLTASLDQHIMDRVQLPFDAKVDETLENHEVKVAAEVHRGFTVEKDFEFLLMRRMVRTSVLDTATEGFASSSRMSTSLKIIILRVHPR